MVYRSHPCDPVAISIYIIFPFTTRGRSPLVIPAFIPSKDRPAQLDLLLTSLEKYMPFIKPYIFVRSTEQAYKDGYKLCESRHKAATLLDERILRSDFLEVTSLDDFTAIFTDDCVAFKKAPQSSEEFIRRYLGYNSGLCVSFRLGLNTTLQDYRTGRCQRPLDAGNMQSFDEGFISWPWQKYPPHDNYGYPIGMDGIIYPSSFLKEITENFNFTSFRTWEGVNSGEPKRWTYRRAWMYAPQHSCVVNIPANSVQDNLLHHSKKCAIDTRVLCDQYLNGSVLRIPDDVVVIGAHQEINYIIE